MTKDKGVLKDGWCRAFGLAANNLGLLALAVAHNLREAKAYYENRQQETENGQQPPETDTIPPPGAPITTACTRRGPPQ